MTEPLARLEERRDDGRIVVTVQGEIDLSNAEQLEQDLERIFAPASAAAIDLTEVAFMDSQGVRLVHHLARRLGAQGIELTVVARPGSPVGELLALTQVDQVAVVRESLEG